MKAEIRSRLLNQIKSLDSEQKSQKSQKIESHLKNLLQDQKGYWAGYQNLTDEPEVDWSHVSENIEWCFPVVQEKALKFKTSSQSYRASSLGVREPIDGVEVDLNKIQGLVIPGVAFDQQGYRLGRGAGFYDRTLAQYSGKKVGVCFDLSLCEELPHEAHDILCDRIVTESLVHSRGDSKWS